MYPKTLKELKKSYSMHTPEDAAFLVVSALCAYRDSAEESYKMLEYLCGPNGFPNFQKQFLKDMLKGKEYKPFSYFVGAVPENNYTPTDYKITIISKRVKESRSMTTCIVYLKSSGSDKPKPITFRYKKSTNEWFLVEQLLLADIWIPIKEDEWA